MKYLIVCSLSLSLNIAYSSSETLVKDFKFENTDCLMTDSCDLESFSLKSYDYNFIFDSKVYGAKAFLSYKTKTVDSLEKYGIVQFIRGCVYSEVENSDGSITRMNNISREFFGNYKRFSHKEWEIDSIDTDPIYNSSMLDNDKSRHLYHRWNTEKGSFNKDTEKYLLHEWPTYPEIYVSDHPSQAYKDGDTVTNVNLEFNACIYKSSDIPLVLAPNDINFATPIACTNWSFSKVYDHSLKKFVSDKKVSETCPIID